MNTPAHSLLTIEQVLKVYKDFHKKNPLFGMDVLARDFSHNDIVILHNDTKGKKGRPIRFGFYALFLRLKGRAKSSVNQYTFDISESSLQLITPGSIFSVETYDDISESYIILFTQNFLFCHQEDHVALENLLAFHEQMIKNVILPSDIFLHVKALYERIDIEIKNENSDYEAMIRLHILELLYILKRAKLLKQRTCTKVLSRAEQITNQYLELVEKHFITQKSVKAYADMLHISSKHLSETVKEITHESALSFIHKRILKEMLYLLSYTDYSIKQIASALNFDTQTTCSRFFKQYQSLSPKNYRLTAKP